MLHASLGKLCEKVSCSSVDEIEETWIVKADQKSLASTTGFVALRL